MTEGPNYPVCETMVDSSDNPDDKLVCFRRPHPGDPWHYDTRGMGVSFRVTGNLGEGVDALLGVTPEQAAAREAPELPTRCPACDSPDPSMAPGGCTDPWHHSHAAHQAMTADAPPPPARLALRGGELDVDAMRAQAPAVRQALLDALRHSAALVRAARGIVVVPEDTYDLVRRLTAAQEVCRQWAQAFTDAAAEAASLVEEEAMTVAGSEQDGVLTSSLFVPDGEGQRIAVRADWRSGESVWDTGSLIGWLAFDEASSYAAGVKADDGGEPLGETDLEVVARQAMARLLTLGRFTPGARAVEELRRKLAGQQRDGDAAVIRQVRSVGPRTYAGVKITREEAK